MKTIRCVLLAACFLAGLSGLMSQTNVDPVHLHTIYATDGSVWKGEIINWDPEFTTLRLLSGVEVEFGTSEIRRVVSISKNGSKEKKESAFKDRGLYNVSTMGVSAGPRFGLTATHAIGYRFSHVISLGGGIGIESFDLGSGNEIVPVFAEARGFLLKKNISPYYAVRVGHGFAPLNSEANVTEARGGAMIHTELGYRFGGRRAANFFAGVAMHWQNAQYLNEWPWESIFYDRVTYRRTELRFGVIF
jgi:hypothetical protein